jgi:TolB-like protein/Tfp pilus assembly protein PilF
MSEARPSFLAELRRRHVVRVAVVYVTVAFALLQAADLAFPRLGLPDWTVTFLLVLALAGLPVALVLAWAFELTPDGVRRVAGSEVREAEPRTRWLSPRSAAVALVALLLAASAGWMAGRTQSPEPAERSVAVLPFANMSASADDAYFSDGLAEELLNTLARIDGLKVAARTSAFAFRDKQVDVRTVGTQLGVATVLEGSVRRDRNNVRVTAQLIDARNGYHLWSETYDAELSAIFEVQERIAQAIAQALQVQLGTGGMIAVRRPASVDAHDLYLLGLDRFHDRDVVRAIGYFDRAVTADPSFAEAWAGLALANAVLPAFDTATPDRAARAARAAAERAMALDDRLAEPYSALCQVMGYFEYRWREAEPVCDAAIARNPNSAIAHQWRAELDLVQGQYAAADSGLARALELDPLAPVPRLLSCMSLHYQGRDRVARACLERMLGMGRTAANARGSLVALHVLAGDSAALVAILASEEAPAFSSPEAGAGVMLKARRDPSSRPALIPRLDPDPPPGTPYTSWNRALLRALIADFEGALAFLQESADRREFNLPQIYRHPAFAPLHRDPRFRAVGQRIGLEPVR